MRARESDGVAALVPRRHRGAAMHPRLKTLTQSIHDAIRRRFTARPRADVEERPAAGRDLDSETADLFEPEPHRALRCFGNVRGPIIAIVLVAAAVTLLVTSPPFANVGRGE